MTHSANTMRAGLDRILELALLIDEDLDRSLTELGVSRTEVRLLWALSQRGPCTQRSLATEVAVTPRAVTGIVDRLSEAELVRRDPHPSDRRATLVSLTQSGTHLTATLREQQQAFATLLFGEMAESQLAGFVAGLDDVLERLRAAVAETRP